MAVSVKVSLSFPVVYQVLEKLRNDESKTGEYLQIFNHKPMAAALYKKVSSYSANEINAVCKALSQGSIPSFDRNENALLPEPFVLDTFFTLRWRIFDILLSRFVSWYTN